MTVSAGVNKRQIDREKSQNDISWVDRLPGRSQVKDPGRPGTADRQTQTDGNPAEKSHSFQRPPHPETFPGAGKIPQSPLPALPRGVPTHTSGRGSWQAPQEPFCTGGVRAGGQRGRREEWRAGRQRAAATQRPQCLPLLPLGTDINNMYIYLYIYIYRYIYIYQWAGVGGWGQTLPPLKDPGRAEVCSCWGWGLRDSDQA